MASLNLSHAHGFTINGGNFGSIGGNVINYTFGNKNPPDDLPMPPPMFSEPQRRLRSKVPKAPKIKQSSSITSPEVVSPPSTAPATSNNSPVASTANSPTHSPVPMMYSQPSTTHSPASMMHSPPSTQYSNAASSLHSGQSRQEDSEQSGNSTYLTANSSTSSASSPIVEARPTQETYLRPNPATSPQPPTANSPLPNPNVLSPLSLDLNRFATPTTLVTSVTPVPAYPSPPKSQRSSPIQRSPYPPNHFQPPPPLARPPHNVHYADYVETIPRAQNDYGPAVRGRFHVVNTTPSPVIRPDTQTMWPQSNIDVHRMAGPSRPLPQEDESDPAVIFRHLQNQRSTKGYSSGLTSATHDTHTHSIYSYNNTPADYNYNQDQFNEIPYRAYDRSHYPQTPQPHTPANYLGLRTATPQPTPPPISPPHSYASPPPVAPLRPHPRHLPTTSTTPAPVPIQAPQASPPIPHWTSEAVTHWSHDVRNPHQHNGSTPISTVSTAFNSFDAYNTRPEQSHHSLPPNNTHHNHTSEWNDTAPSFPFHPNIAGAVHSLPGGGGNVIGEDGNGSAAGGYGHLSPFMINPAVHSPVGSTYSGRPEMGPQRELREPGFVLPFGHSIAAA